MYSEHVDVIVLHASAFPAVSDATATLFLQVEVSLPYISSIAYLCSKAKDENSFNSVQKSNSSRKRRHRRV